MRIARAKNELAYNEPHNLTGIWKKFFSHVWDWWRHLGTISSIFLVCAICALFLQADVTCSCFVIAFCVGNDG